MLREPSSLSYDILELAQNSFLEPWIWDSGYEIPIGTASFCSEPKKTTCYGISEPNFLRWVGKVLGLRAESFGLKVGCLA